MELAEKLWSNIKETETCWIWLGRKQCHGYGVLSLHRRDCLVHRIAWELSYEQVIPQGLEVLHKCDNPACVNPDHLFLGTQKDNLDDMRAKGRGKNPILFGEQHPLSKLTISQVREIKNKIKSGDKLSKIATEYGVTKNCIWSIKQGLTWIGV